MNDLNEFLIKTLFTIFLLLAIGMLVSISFLGIYEVIKWLYS